MKTIIHAYYFNLDSSNDAAAYKALKSRMKAAGVKCFESWNIPGESHYKPELGGRELELETAFLFNDQWNTAPIEGISVLGLRVFDWAQDYVENKRIKRGHYLDITEEMRAIRRDTLICGYCGENYPPGTVAAAVVAEVKAEIASVFCAACLDSQYLKESDLRLLRLLPVESHKPSRPGKSDRGELSAEERAKLIPAYVKRQTTGEDSRAVKERLRVRAAVESKRAQVIHGAETEYNGMVWLLDRGMKIDNVIYYDRADKFSFGWREPVSEDVTSKLVDLLCEFPYAYEIKSESRGLISTRDGMASHA